MTRSPLQTAKSQISDRHAKAAHNQRERHKHGARQDNNASATMPAVEVPAAASLTPEQMYSNFEEWIKMCTDNVTTEGLLKIVY